MSSAHLPTSPSSEASVTPDPQDLPSFLELRMGCRGAAPCVSSLPGANTPLLCSPKGSTYNESTGQWQHRLLCDVKTGVITRSRRVAQDLTCGTGSAQHRGGHCSKPQAMCSERVYKSHLLPPLSQVAMAYREWESLLLLIKSALRQPYTCL